MAAYGVDTLAAATTPRRVWVLLNRLPPEARHPGEPWSAEAELLAIAIDHLAQLTYVMVKQGGGKANRPRPLPRPPRGPVITVGAEPGPRRVHGAEAPRELPPGSTGSWLDAAAQLAIMPNVRVVSD
jgi:hypothetical protein